MKTRASVSHPGLRYEAFLFEPLGEDSNGAPLALASLLGRMGVDPWSEAALLASLPADVAAKKLISLMAALPTRLYSQAQSQTLADRLIKLLPATADPARPESALPSKADAHGRRRLISYLSWIALACVLVLGMTLG